MMIHNDPPVLDALMRWALVLDALLLWGYGAWCWMRLCSGAMVLDVLMLWGYSAGFLRIQ